MFRWVLSFWSWFSRLSIGFEDVIGPVTDLIGGHLNRKEARAQQDKNIAMQREFAQHGVRWRVEDAQAAGVHPLFALGAQTQGFTPNPVVSDSYSEIGRAGQNMGNAIARSMDTEQKLAAKAQLRALESQTNANDAQASMYRSQAMLNLQEYGKPGFPSEDTDVIVGPAAQSSLRRSSQQEDFESPILPLDLQRSREYGWKDYDFGNGAVTLMRGDPDQLMSDLQDMDMSTRAAIIAENVKRGQGRAIAKLFDALGDVSKQKGKEYGKQWGGYSPYKSPTYPRGRVYEH